MELPVFFWFELVSLLAAVFFAGKFKYSFLILFLPFLLLTCLVELLGLYYKFELRQPNGWIYNLYMLIEFPFWVGYYYYLSRDPKERQVILIAGALLVSFSLINLAFIQKISAFNSYTQNAGALLIIGFSAHYFYSLLRRSEDLQLFRNAYFWISSGCLFYYTGTFLYFALYPYLIEIHSKSNNELFSLININLIVVFYSCIALGLSLHRNQSYGNSHYSY